MGRAACLMLLAATAAGAAEYRYEVRRDGLLRDRPGTLVFDDAGIRYRQRSGKPARSDGGVWAYRDIQALWLWPDRLTLVTYRDRVWRLGADEAYQFTLAQPGSFAAVYEMLKHRLDQRLVSGFVQRPAAVEWEVPVKLTGALRGSEGFLRFAPDCIVYATLRPHASRTWRWQDIENVSSSGPFELTLTTFERSRTHYGSRRDFQFQLKQRLDGERLQQVWLRIHDRGHLSVLEAIVPRN